MKSSRIALLGGLGIIVITVTTWSSHRVGYARGAEAGLRTGTEAAQVGQGVAALSVIRHLEDGRHEAALTELDSLVDAGIAAHWLRQKAPSRYSEAPESLVELVEHLEEYRRSRPSRAASKTPNIHRLVAEYLDRSS